MASSRLRPRRDGPACRSEAGSRGCAGRWARGPRIRSASLTTPQQAPGVGRSTGIEVIWCRASSPIATLTGVSCGDRHGVVRSSASGPASSGSSRRCCDRGSASSPLCLRSGSEQGRRSRRAGRFARPRRRRPRTTVCGRDRCSRVLVRGRGRHRHSRLPARRPRDRAPRASRSSSRARATSSWSGESGLGPGGGPPDPGAATGRGDPRRSAARRLGHRRVPRGPVGRPVDQGADPHVVRRRRRAVRRDHGRRGRLHPQAGPRQRLRRHRAPGRGRPVDPRPGRDRARSSSGSAPDRRRTRSSRR